MSFRSEIYRCLQDMTQRHILKVLQLWEVQASIYHDSVVGVCAALEDHTLRFRKHRQTQCFHQGDHSAWVSCLPGRSVGAGT